MKHIPQKRTCGVVIAGMVLVSAFGAGCKSPVVLPPGTGAEPVLPRPHVVVPSANTTSSARSTALKAGIAADKQSYARGQIIRFTLTLQNTGKQPERLAFNSGQSFDITASARGNAAPAWRWSHGKLFSLALRELELRAGESQSWTATWDQNDNNGNALRRGEYTVVGRVTANGSVATAPITIRLTD